MILPEVACLADASGVEFAVSVLAESGQLVPPLAMVAVLAHARSVVDPVDVRTLRDLVAVFHFFARHCVGFLQSSLDQILLFRCRLSHPLLWLLQRQHQWIRLRFLRIGLLSLGLFLLRCWLKCDWGFRRIHEILYFRHQLLDLFLIHVRLNLLKIRVGLLVIKRGHRWRMMKILLMLLQRRGFRLIYTQ